MISLKDPSVVRDAVQRMTRRARRKILNGQKTTFERTYMQLVARTPEDSGEAKGNWYIGINRSPNVVSRRSFPNNVGARSYLNDRIGSFNKLGLLVANNRLPRMGLIENGGFKPASPGPSLNPDPRKFGRVLISGGRYTQAPQGVLKVTFREIVSQVPAIMRSASERE